MATTNYPQYRAAFMNEPTMQSTDTVTPGQLYVADGVVVIAPDSAATAADLGAVVKLANAADRRIAFTPRLNVPLFEV